MIGRYSNSMGADDQEKLKEKPSKKIDIVKLDS